MIYESVTTAPFVGAFNGVHKMGEVRINLTNFITVGLMAFVAVWLINHALSMSPTTSKYKA
jgi:hypothetical protein